MTLKWDLGAGWGVRGCWQQVSPGVRRKGAAFPPRPKSRDPVCTLARPLARPRRKAPKLPQELLVSCAVSASSSTEMLLCFGGSGFYKTFGGKKKIHATSKCPRCPHISWGAGDRPQEGPLSLNANHSSVSVVGRFPNRPGTGAPRLDRSELTWLHDFIPQRVVVKGRIKPGRDR